MSDPCLKDEKIYVILSGVAPGVVLSTTLDYTQVLLASSIVPLGIAGIYASALFSIQGYNFITGTCFADQSGTIQWEFSSDAVNWDGIQSLAYTANDPLGFSVPGVAPNFRLRFINGAVAQTTFRLYVYQSKTIR